MTMLIKLENGIPVGYPILEENFRQAFPNIDLPRLIAASDVEQHGYGLYDFDNQPELGKYQKAVEVAPKRNEFGIWKQTWQVVEKDAAEKAAEDEAKAEVARNERTRLLFLSDWTQLNDAPVNQQAWANYRQQLRDITAQPGFPWDINWPVAP